MRLASSIDIRRTPADVWAFLGDLSNLPKWDRGVARAIAASPSQQQQPPPSGIGIEFHTETHAGSPGNSADRGKMSYRVANVDPIAQRCTIDLTSSAGNARFFRSARWIFEVTPAPDGSRVNCAVEFTVRPQYFFMAPLLYLNRRAIGSDLENLKRILESPTD